MSISQRAGFIGLWYALTLSTFVLVTFAQSTGGPRELSACDIPTDNSSSNETIIRLSGRLIPASSAILLVTSWCDGVNAGRLPIVIIQPGDESKDDFNGLISQLDSKRFYSGTIEGRLKTRVAVEHSDGKQGFVPTLEYTAVGNLSASHDYLIIPRVTVCELTQNLPKYIGRQVIVSGSLSGYGSQRVLSDSQCTDPVVLDGIEFPRSLFINVDQLRLMSSFSLNSVDFETLRDPRNWTVRRLGPYRSTHVRATLVGTVVKKPSYEFAACNGRRGTPNGFGPFGQMGLQLVVESVEQFSRVPGVQPNLELPDSWSMDCPRNIPAPSSVCATIESLPEAVGRGCSDRVGALLDLGAYQGMAHSVWESLLISSVEMGYTDVIKKLLSGTFRGAVIPGKVWCHAVGLGRTEILALLLNLIGDDYNRLQVSCPLLAVSAEFGNVGVMRLLLEAEKRGEIAFGSDEYRNAIEKARDFRQIEQLRLLVEYNADINAIDKSGQTVLLNEFREQPSLAMVRNLLRLGADVNFQGPDGETALMWAVKRLRADVVAELLTKGADVNSADNLGRTALMFAASSGYADCLLVLLSNGSDVSLTDKDGKTAIEYVSGRNVASLRSIISGFDTRGGESEITEPIVNPD